MEEDPQQNTTPGVQPVATRQTSQGSSGKPTKPKGILKNHSEARDLPTQLHWDEQNLNYNEDNRAATMKITEPKTPYVRYDAETDTVMDLDQIPGFELGATDPGSAQEFSAGSTSGSASAQSSRHSSFSYNRSASGSLPGSRRSSDSGEKKVDIVVDENAPLGGLPPSSDDEDESRWDESTRIKHAIFKNMRKSHYGNEAEAMKRAAELLAEEEAIDDGEDDAPPVPVQNGVHADA